MSGYLPSILAMLFCIVMSAYFSATETAFSSLNKTRLKAMAAGGHRKAQLTLKLAEDYDRLISTILIGNNIVNIAVASIGTVLFVKLCGDIGATISTVVVTVLVLIFGEITPKSIAKDHPEKFAMFSAPLIHALIVVFKPLNFVFSQWKRLVARLFQSKDEEKMSQEELLLLLREVEEEGGIDEDESELLQNAVEFGELRAEDILTHRTDIEAVSVDATKDEVSKVFTESRFSRLPVYEGSLDRIVGVIHQKDFYVDSGVTPKPLREVMTPPLFVSPSQKIDNLLKLLQAHKAHIAVVIDEYGGTLGIVTMEDILEELVGEIWDEHDEVEVPFRKVDEQTYIIDGTVSFDDFCEHFGIKDEAESVSLGGWVTEKMEKIPAQGESFTYGDLTVIVEAADSHRVEAVRVLCKPTASQTVEV